MLIKNIKQERIFITLLWTILLSFIVNAASFDFNPMPPLTFNLSEEVYWIYNVNITVNENLVNFSLEETPFPNLTINPTNGIMQFTPQQEDVGLSNYYLIIVKNLSSPAVDYITRNIRFNISNMNDAPNITGYSPNNTNASVAENSSINFTITVDDPDIGYGDYNNYSWLFNGVLQSNEQNWSYSPGMCSAGNYNVTVIVNDSEGAFDFNYWNLTVNNSNRVPVFNKTIQNLSWQEDTNLTNNFTLDDHFYDLDFNLCNGTNNDTLTYGVIGNNSIRVVINSTTRQVSFYPTLNFFGVEYIKFYLNDSHNITYSNNITLNVTTYPDPPVLAVIPNQTIYINIRFTYQVNATDPDNDPLVYYDNATFFDINESSGLINFTPNSSHIGIYHVNITVSDTIYNVSQIVVFNISNNTAPVLDPIGNLSATEGTPFYYDVNATDLESDTLTFFDNTTMFDINPTTGVISFTPVQDDVGNHTIRIGVNDSKGAVDYEIINFSVSNVNNPPNLTLIPNQTMRYDKLFTLYIHGVDLDNDQLNFSSNSSMFNITTINLTSGVINFTPTLGDFGVHIINITVSDGSENDSQLVWFNITGNHAPVLQLIPNQTITVNNLFTMLVNATDQDNDELNFTDNATIFNMTSYNETTGLINFTPTTITVYVINISVSDGNMSDFQLVWFNVTGNHAPNITSYYPISVNVSVVEGSSIYFNVSVYDEDGDDIVYNWSINGVFKSNTSSWNYTPGYTEAGNYNVTITASDGNSTDSHFWNLTVNNSNRVPIFGLINHTSASHFGIGTNSNTSTSLESGNVTLAMMNSTHFYSNGTYLSAAILIPVDYFDHVSLGNISWSSVTPTNTSLVFKVRNSTDNSTWSNWTIFVNSSGQPLSTSSKYIQYSAEFSTNVSNTTPKILDVGIRYNIPDFTGNEDVQYNNWIDLDDYFSDPDGETLSYNYTPVNNVQISIDSNNRVTLIPSANWYGTVYTTFIAIDSDDNTSSNNVSIIFQNVVEPDSPSVVYVSGGGGGSSTIQKETKVVNQTELVTIELVVPGPLSTVTNETLVAPILLKNNGNKTLRGVTLSAFTNSTEIFLSFSKAYFSEIGVGEQKKTEIYITAKNITGVHNIVVTAQVESPALNDTAIIQLNALENFTTKINFVRDFLNTHPECLELTEAIERAKTSLLQRDYETANLLLDSAIDGCKYLISSSERMIEVQRPDVSLSRRVLERILANKEVSYTIIFLLLTTLLISFYVWYNIRTEI